MCAFLNHRPYTAQTLHRQKHSTLPVLNTFLPFLPSGAPLTQHTCRGEHTLLRRGLHYTGITKKKCFNQVVQTAADRKARNWQWRGSSGVKGKCIKRPVCEYAMHLWKQVASCLDQICLEPLVPYNNIKKLKTWQLFSCTFIWSKTGAAGHPLWCMLFSIFFDLHISPY